MTGEISLGRADVKLPPGYFGCGLAVLAAVVLLTFAALFVAARFAAECW